LQLAAGKRLFVYAVGKGGKVRVSDLVSGARCLLQDHSCAVTDLQACELLRANIVASLSMPRRSSSVGRTGWSSAALTLMDYCSSTLFRSATNAFTFLLLTMASELSSRLAHPASGPAPNSACCGASATCRLPSDQADCSCFLPCPGVPRVAACERLWRRRLCCSNCRGRLRHLQNRPCDFADLSSGAFIRGQASSRLL